MANNKEYTILVVDVRKSASETFKLKATKCCFDIINKMICCGKKDYLSFVLVGTEKTFNDMCDTEADGHLNITQYEGELQRPSSKLLLNFYQFINATPSDNGEWLDAIVVALGLLQKGSAYANIKRKRIILFYDFNDTANSYESFEDVIGYLLDYEVALIVLCENVKFVDNPENDNLTQVIFESAQKSPQRLDNEKHALRLVSECSAKLYNFTESLSSLLH